MIKKRYYGYEDLDLVRDRIKLSSIASFITTHVLKLQLGIVAKFHFSDVLGENISLLIPINLLSFKSKI